MMTMKAGRGRGSTALRSRVERTLVRCLEWSQRGRHRRVLEEVERLLPEAEDHPALAAHLLIWKAQALLAMDCADRALPAAMHAWDLQSTPHACHLMATALAALGEPDRSEELLAMGARLFPDAVHLPVQLAMLMTDQGRLPEALDTLDDLPSVDELPDDLQIFVLGLKANLLAAMGRWWQADDVLRAAIELFPDSAVLQETQASLTEAWGRQRAEQRLLRSWHAGLAPLAGVAAEVDDAIVRLASLIEVQDLVAVAARRLWRAMLEADPVRPQSPDAWAAATLAAIADIDGGGMPVAALARATGCNLATVRSALRRLRAFLDPREPGMVRRAFAATSNPQLDEDRSPDPVNRSQGQVIPFPTR